MDSDLSAGSRCAVVGFWLATFLLPVGAAGAGLQEAHITAVVREVNLAALNLAMRRAAVNDSVGTGTTVTTRADSRAELTFNDGAVARLGRNTVLSLKSRSLWELGRGAVLVDALRGAKAKIRAGGVAVEMPGATGMLEYQSPTFKFLVLEGAGRVYRPGHLGDSVLVGPGQMVFGSADANLFDPVDLDISRLVETCLLIRNFAPLQSEKWIVAASQRQQREKSKKVLIETNLVMSGGETAVTVVDRMKATSAGNPAEHSAAGGQSPLPISTTAPASTAQR